MQDTKLSKNFTLEELACKGEDCCGGSSPFDGQSRLVAALQQLRDAIGRPLRITSGFRCVRHNGEIGGKMNSQHTRGGAVDVVPPPGMSVGQLAEAAETVAAFRRGGIGQYWAKGFVHVDVREDGPKRWAQ